MNKNSKKSDLYSDSLVDEILSNIPTEDYEKTRKRMLLAARIDEALKAKGWKKKDLAVALNKKPSVITKWLGGTYNFTADTLWDIERVLNINLIILSDSDSRPVASYYLMISQKAGNRFYENNFSDYPTILNLPQSTQFNT